MMRNLLTVYKSLSVDELSDLGKSVLSGRITRPNYRRVVAMIAGGLQYHKHYPDAVLEMLFVRGGAVTAFDVNMLRVSIHKHQDTIRSECRNLEEWQEMFAYYPGTLSLDNAGERREERRDDWKRRMRDYHDRRRGGGERR